MPTLSDPVTIVALAAAVTALLALGACGLLHRRVRRLLAAQSTVLGESGSQDLIAHAAGLHESFGELQRRFDILATELTQRADVVERRLDGAVSHRALVHYDAFGETAGRQSLSLALLDAHRNGVVLSSIAHRDTARLYCKPVAAGEGSPTALSPEEREAVALAMTQDAPGGARS